QDGRRQPFDEDKLRAGLLRALEKRPVSVEQIEAALGRIKHRLRATGEREVKAMVVGEMVMAELKELDEVAYIRFASVYRRFQDLSHAREEIDRRSGGGPADGGGAERSGADGQSHPPGRAGALRHRTLTPGRLHTGTRRPYRRRGL